MDPGSECTGDAAGSPVREEGERGGEGVQGEEKLNVSRKDGEGSVIIMYLHQHSWRSCSRTQGLRGVATTGHGSCHLEAGRGRER